MPDLVIIDGDQAMFMTAFGAAIVLVGPGKLSGTGKSTVKGKKICLEGDEKKVEVPGCMYTTPQYIIPGIGTLKIDALGGDQTSKNVKDSGKGIILKGGQFTAKFEVQSPAKDPSVAPAPPQPDSTSSYSGQGNFITTNTKVKAD